MADKSALNFKKEFEDIPSDSAEIGEYGGRVKCMFASWDSADDVANGTTFAALVAADTVQLFKIPSGARILRQSSNLTAGDTYQKTVSGVQSPVVIGEKLVGEAQVQVTLNGADIAGHAFIEYLLD